jgi:ribosomal protein S27AE
MEECVGCGALMGSGRVGFCVGCAWWRDDAKAAWPTLTTRRCVGCGKPHDRPRSKVGGVLPRYCSTKCERAKKARKWRAKRDKPLVRCPRCGVEFKLNRKDKLYCTRKCGTLAWKEKKA